MNGGGSTEWTVWKKPIRFSTPVSSSDQSRRRDQSTSWLRRNSLEIRHTSPNFLTKWLTLSQLT
jgi:hypothetical protein